MWSAGSRTTGAEHECWNCFKLLAKKKKSTFRYFCQDSQRGPNLPSDSLLTTQNRSATRSASGRGHWPTPATWTPPSLSLTQRICTRTILGSGFSSFCVVLLMNQHQHQHNLLESVFFKLTWSVSFPFDSETAPRTCSGPTRTQSSDYFTCWLLSGLNQQPGLHFSDKKKIVRSIQPMKNKDGCALTDYMTRPGPQQRFSVSLAAPCQRGRNMKHTSIVNTSSRSSHSCLSQKKQPCVRLQFPKDSITLNGLFGSRKQENRHAVFGFINTRFGQARTTTEE